MFWIVFGLFLVAFNVVGFVVFKCVKAEEKLELTGLSELVYFSILVKDIQVFPAKIPAKIFIFTLCMSGAVISYSYNAGLVSLLSVELFWYPINSIEVRIYG